jgi:hypothetical protein
MSPGTITDTLAAAAACRAAERCGLLAALADAPGRPVEPDRLGLDPRLTSALLEALGALGVLDRHGPGAWQIDPATVQAIERAGLLWDVLEPALRCGRAAIRSAEAGSAAAGYPDVAGDLQAMWNTARELSAGQLTAIGRRVLGVDAGTAAWSRALLVADPSGRPAAAGLAPVLAIAAGALSEAGLAARVDLVAVDLTSGPLPPGCDLILLAGVCHLLGPDALAELFGRIEEVAAPRATLVVVDLLGDESPPGPTTAALYALGLALRSQAGGLPSFATCARLMHRAGFGSIERVDLDGRLSAVRARKLNGDGPPVEHDVAGESQDAVLSRGETRR